MPPPVQRRHVFYICGYDWKAWDYYASLFERELERHCNVTGAHSILELPLARPDGSSVTWRCQVQDGGKPVETTVEFLLWDNIINRFRARSRAYVLAMAVLALADNIITGTLFRITKLNWRFALFWIYPIVMMAALVLVSAAIGMATYLAAMWAGGDDLTWLIGACLMAGVTFFGVLAIEDRRRGLALMLLNALIFNLYHTRRNLPQMDCRLDDWLARVSVATADPSLDEVLIVGHSWGTIHAVDLAARLTARLPDGLATQPGTGENRPVLSVMTIGSTTPAMALHPAAGWLRDKIRILATSPHILWVEYQARKDFINFPQTDPVSGAGVDLALDSRHATIACQVKFRDLLHRRFYNKIRNNLFRLHFQFIMANDIVDRDYDYFDIVTGDTSLWQRNGLTPDCDK